MIRSDFLVFDSRNESDQTIENWGGVSFTEKNLRKMPVRKKYLCAKTKEREGGRKERGTEGKKRDREKKEREMRV